MEFRVLGPVTAVNDGDSVHLRPKERQVLAVLLANSGRPVSMDSLIDDLWPAQLVTTGLRNSLRVHVSNLRTALRTDPSGPSHIGSSSQGYAVLASAGTVDAGRFAAALSRTRALSHSDPVSALRCARSVWPLWVGEPYSGLDSASIDRHRAYLFSVYRDFAIELARLESAYAPNPDCSMLRRLAEDEPSSEPLACALARAEYRHGHQARALHVLAQLRRFLDDELGLIASAKVRELETAILNDDPELASPRLPHSPASAGPATSSDHFDTVEAIKAHVVRGGTRVAVIGNPGMGKSRLLRAVVSALPGAVYLPGRETSQGLAKLRRLAIDLADRTGTDFAGGWHSAAPSDGAAPHDAALGAQLRQLLGALDGPVLVVDDVEELDADSRLVLTEVLAHLGDDLTVVVAASSYRGAAELIAADAAAVSGAVSHLREFTLGPIDREACIETLQEAGFTGSPEDLERAGEQVLVGSGGHPFLAGGLARALAIEAPTPAVSVAPLVPAVPQSSIEFVRRLRERLNPQVGHVLNLAVVDGPRFDIAVVANAAQLPVAEVVEAVETLMAFGLVVADPAVVIAPGFTPPLLASLGLAKAHLHLELAAAHRRAGRAADRVVHHLREAGPLADPALLAEAAAIAGATSADAGALEVSLEFYDLAADRGKQAGLPGETLFAWQLAAVRVAFRAGRLDRGTDDAAALALAAEVVGQTQTFALASVLAASPGLPELDQRVRARRLLDRARRRFDEFEVSTRVRVLEALVRCLALDNSPPAHELLIEVAAELRTALTGATDAETEGLALLGLRQAEFIDGTPARLLLDLSERATTALRATPLVLSALRAQCVDALAAGDSRAQSVLVEYADISELVRDPWHCWTAHRLLAVQDWKRGESGEGHLAMAGSLEPLIDPDMVALVDAVQGLGQLWAASEWATALGLLDEVGPTDPIFDPVLSLARQAMRAESGLGVDELVVTTSLADLGASSIQLAGFAMAAMCVSSLDQETAVDVAQACRFALAPHTGGRVVIEGGMADLGAVDDFLQLVQPEHDFIAHTNRREPTHVDHT